MTEAQVLALINQWIVTNGNNEITADVLRPILVAILEQPNDVTGDLSNLNTTANTNLVAAINQINTALSTITNSGIKLYSGTPNPNTTPPLSFNTADFYIQVDGLNAPVQLWQYNGTAWVNTEFNPSDYDLSQFDNESEDPFAHMSDIGGGDFIPLTGTTEGNPVTGVVETISEIKFIQIEGENPAKISSENEDGSKQFWEIGNDGAEGQLYIFKEDGLDGTTIVGGRVTAKTLVVEELPENNDAARVMVQDETTKEVAWVEKSSIGGGDVTSVNGQTGVVVLDADDIADGTTNKAYTATEKTKLAGIATGATANQSDATTNAAIAAKLDNTTTALGALVASADLKAIPIDADKFGYSDSEDSNDTKVITWGEVKAILDARYELKPPSIPSLTVTPLSTGATLTWTSGLNPGTSYNIYRSTDGTTFSLLTTDTASPFTDSTIGEFWYKVIATNTTGESGDSNVGYSYSHWGLQFNTSLNAIDWGSNQTSATDWHIKIRMEIDAAETRFMPLCNSSASAYIMFENTGAINFLLAGSTYTISASGNNADGNPKDWRNLKTGMLDWEFIKSGTTLTVNVNGVLFHSITISNTALSYRYFGRWSTNNGYDFLGKLDYIEIDGTMYNYANNYGGKTKTGVTAIQLDYGENLETFALAGQSNAVARNNATDNSFTGITHPISGAKYWNITSGTFQDMTVSINQYLADVAGDWGVEQRIADNLRIDGKQSRILKYAAGGTSLEVSWAAGSSLSSGLNLYMRNSGIAYKNLLWFQGEADATNATYAANYQVNLIRAINRWRRNTTNGHKTRIIIFKLANFTALGYDYNATIQAAQEYVAANVSNVEIVPVPVGATFPDGQHFDAVSIDNFAQASFPFLQLAGEV